MKLQARRLNSHSTYAVLLFLVISILEGTVFLTNVGALTLPDGDMHANASYAMATGQIMNLPERSTDKFGNTVKRQHISGDARYLHNKSMHNALVMDIIGDPMATDPHMANQRLADHLPSTQVTLPDKSFPSRTNQYFPLVYLPQGIGVWVGLHTGLGPYNVWQCGRIANFIFYLFLFCLSIVMIPRGKYLMAVLGSLYPTIFMATSLMSDAMFISVCACFIAYFFSLSTRDRPVTRVQMGILIGLTVCLFLFKTVYVALALLVWALPRSLLTTKRKATFMGLSALIALPIYGLWSSLYQNVPAIASISGNTHFMFRHPLKVIFTISWNLMEFPKTLIRIGSAVIVRLHTPVPVRLGLYGRFLLRGLPGISLHRSHLERYDSHEERPSDTRIPGQVSHPAPAPPDLHMLLPAREDGGCLALSQRGRYHCWSFRNREFFSNAIAIILDVADARLCCPAPAGTD